MRLLSLTLEGQYKGLKDQYFDFECVNGSVVGFIGLNGSGKSQLFELIAEIFAYAERHARRDFKVNSGFPFAFSLVYELESRRYKLKANKNSYPHFYLQENDHWSQRDPSPELLPRYFVGYSSGLNNNLANAFLKNTIQYYEVERIRENYRKEQKQELDAEQFDELNYRYAKKHPKIFEIDNYGEVKETISDISRLIYIDYDSSRLAIASLSMLNEDQLKSIFQPFGYQSLKEIVFRFDFTRGQISDDTVSNVKHLIKIAGKENCKFIGHFSKDFYNRFDLEFKAGDICFDLNRSDVKDRFNEFNYGDPLTFFTRLFKAQQLGAKKWGANNITELKKDDYFGSIKKPLKIKLPITIKELVFVNKAGDYINYDDLSDGEAQLLEVLSLVKLFSSDNSRTLFLLDEPETHLNPSWRTHFYSYVSNAISDDIKDVQLFISTHSPFMISSLKRSNVFIFSREENGTIRMQSAANETYGASLDVLIKELFGLRSLISHSVIDEIREQLKQGDQQAREWIESNLGSSPEKAYLLRKLSQ